MGAETLIEESNRQDEIFVVNFNDEVKLGLAQDQPFSDSVPQLRTALARGVPAGKTAVYDAVAVGLKHLELGTRDKKTLVLISDGGDNASHISRHEALDKVQRSIATIYGVGLFDLDAPDRDLGLIRQLAKVSGGEAYFPESPAQMAPVWTFGSTTLTFQVGVGLSALNDSAQTTDQVEFAKGVRSMLGFALSVV